MIEGLISKIQARLKDGAYPNEAAISFSVVMPILRNLGWDDSDPQEVMPEYASGGRRVDFALCAMGNRPSIFIEVKGVGRVLDGDKQLFEYAFHEGIPLCLLTDGREWSFYLPGAQGSYDERRVYRLQLNERSPAECGKILTRYLDRARVKSGDAFEDAMRDYRDMASRREASRSLPAAWEKLVSEPEDLLVELLGEQTEALSGFRPSTFEIIGFLRSLRADQVRAKTLQTGKSGPVKQQIGIGGENAGPPARLAQSQNGRSLSYSWLGQDRSAPNASAAFVDILTSIALKYPARIEDVAMAARGRSRNHIGRSAEEIYPSRPDLARAASIGGGWLVGLNIANREKMRILKESCRIVGLKFGSDVIVQMPNADS